MADDLFNNAIGRDIQFALNVNNNTPANAAFVVVLLTAVEGDDVLNNYTDLNALLTAAGNTEPTDAEVTNYIRKVLTDTDGIVVTVDNTANTVNLDIPDQVYTALGGTNDGTFVKALICYDEDTTTSTDSTIIPVYYFDVPVSDNTTNGQDFTLRFHTDGVITQ